MHRKEMIIAAQQVATGLPSSGTHVPRRTIRNAKPFPLKTSTWIKEFNLNVKVKLSL
jgi:hypothetical protein